MIKFALEMIRRACAAAGKWPYTVWFEIGCALHFELGDEGFAIFDAWSRASPTYNVEHCAAKWRECAKIHTFKIGTIFHYANLAFPGWRSVFEAQRLAQFAWPCR
jgi:putative DNA primase/helicase